jgi:hypothetical protein
VLTDIGYVVGVDLSVTATGLADSTGRCASVGRKGLTAMPLPARCDALKGIVGQAWRWKAESFGGKRTLMVIEGLQARGGKGNGGKDERAFMWHWLVTLAFNAGELVAVVPPNTLKKVATGNGTADKRLMLTTVHGWGRWPVGKDHNQADAAGLCAIGSQIAGFGIVDFSPDAVQRIEQIKVEGKTDA